MKNLLSIINALDTSHPNHRTVLLHQNVSKFIDFNRKSNRIGPLKFAAIVLSLTHRLIQKSKTK